MKILITGASGYIGSSLVPYLQAKAHELVVVGRDPEKLRELFPDAATSGYADLTSALVGCNTVIHLAVVNNGSAATAEEFRSGNVGLLCNVAAAAEAGHVPHFINITSTHAGDTARTDAYSQSKRAGEVALLAHEALCVTQIRIPAAYDFGDFRGRLSVLNKLPSSLQRTIFFVLAAVRPTVSLDRLNQAISENLSLSGNARRQLFVTDRQKDNWVYHGIKWLMDISFAVFVVVVFWWLLLGAALLIRLNSKGPVLFRQERVGRNATPFTCIKFRTMAQGTQQVGSHDAPASAITSVGRILRRTKIDELPQVINIFRNEMSLVGPRPSLPSQREVILHRKQLNVYDVVPGITGLAQIRDIDMSMPKQLAETDAEYFLTRTLATDIGIIWATLTGRGQGDRVR
jgi:lipopolysaccharide/colanic/teichoic acid biosynthesis glycosyltransferase